MIREDTVKLLEKKKSALYGMRSKRNGIFQ